MRRLQLTAIIMAALIVSLPVVLAQELTLTKLQGSNGAMGYSRVQDELTIEAMVKIPGEDVITPQQVRLYVDEAYAFFDNCTSAGNGYYKCIFYDPEFQAYKPITFTIELRDDDGNVIASQTKTLIPDNIAPVVQQMTIQPPVSDGGVAIDYKAEDRATITGPPTDCSGIKTATIASGQETIATDAGALGECIKQNEIKTTRTVQGKQTICTTARDQVNYTSGPKCEEVTIDTAAPQILQLLILDQLGFEITHVHSGEERIADVNVRINESGEISQAAANFVQLNPSMPDFLPPDLIKGNIYSWQDIPVKEVGTCKITVLAKDTLGNEATKDFPCVIKSDDKAPTVKAVLSEVQQAGLPLFGYGTELVVEFEDLDNTNEAGIGIASSDVILDLSNLGMGEAQPDKCARLSGTLWRCTWLLNPPLSTGEGTFQIKFTKLTDSLGNAADLATAQYEIVYDNLGPKPPEILGFEVISEIGTTKKTAVRGDTVRYTVRSGDFELAYADFSEIGGSINTTAYSCDDLGNNTQDCKFEGLVDLSGSYTAPINFSFYDAARNRASTATKLEVYGIDNETSPKYWKNATVTCTPSLIDRKTAELVPAYISCRIDLETPRTDITTLTVVGPSSPEDCTGDIELTVNDLYVTNNYEGSKSPYLFIILEPKQYFYNEMQINCPLQVFSKRGVTRDGQTKYFVSSTPQQVPANISMKFYNNPLEDVTKNVDKKIKKALKDGLASHNYLTDLNKILAYGKLICQVKTILTNIIGVLFALALLLGIAGVAADSALPGAGQAEKQLAVTVCNYEEGVSEGYKDVLNFLDSICSIVNCAATSEKSGVEGYAGGMACENIDKYIKEAVPAGMQATAEAVGGDIFDIKESLILSTVCFCVPGIIYNMEKLRQAHCFKAVCLNDYIKEEGYPVSFCDDTHDFLICQFVIGQIFALIPFAAFFDNLINIVLDVITDPVKLFTVLLGSVCEAVCPELESDPAGYAVCAIYKTVSVLSEAVASVMLYSKNSEAFRNPVGNVYCERAEEIGKDL